MQRNAYSRFVALAKVVLPLVALGLFATMFLIARQIDPDAAIPFSEVDVAQFAREARIGAPRFAGVTQDGTVVELAAQVVRPDPDAGTRMLAEGLAAEFQIPDGSGVGAIAGAGSIDTALQQFVLSGGVDMQTSNGYRLQTPSIIAALERTEIVSEGRVLAEGPPGRIEAGSLRITQSDAPAAEGESGRYVLIFNGGVSLVYDPAQPGEN
jgi:lipopolysaccharide export system protein LptC